MTKSEKEILNAFLSKTLNMDETAVASLYNEDDTLKPESKDALLTLDTARIKRVKDQSQLTFDNGHKAGKAEALTDLETQFKDEFKFDSAKHGLELIRECFNKKVKSKEVTEEDVKKHPLYLEVEKQVNTVKTEVESSWKKKLDEKDAEYKQKDQFNKIEGIALDTLSEMKPILSKDEKKASFQRKLFLTELKDCKFEESVQKDGTKDYLVLKEDGIRMEDGHGSPVFLSGFVKEVATKYYDFEEADPRSSGGDPNEKDKNKGKGGAGDPPKHDFKVHKPADVTEYGNMLSEINGLSIEQSEKVKLKTEVMNLWKGPAKK